MAISTATLDTSALDKVVINQNHRINFAKFVTFNKSL